MSCSHADVPGVYFINNILDGRIYVGSSMRWISIRWAEHLKQLRANRHHSIFLQRSWNKYGEEAFTFEVVEIVRDASLLLVREQHWIDRTRSCEKTNGFNISPTAGNSAGRSITKETRARMAAAKIGKHPSPETTAKMSASRTGRVIPDETRRKIAAAHIGMSSGPLSIEHRAKISKGGKGLRRSAKTCARIALASIAREAVKREMREKAS